MKLKNTKMSTPMLVFIIVLVAALLILPNFVNPYFQQVLIQILMYAYLGSCWNIIGGFAGQFSLGHALYIGIGAYTTTILYNNWAISPWIGGLVGAVVSAIVSILIGYPCFKLRSTYYTLTSLAICTVAMLGFQSVDTVGGIKLGAYGGLKLQALNKNSFWDFQFVNKMYYYYIIAAMLVIILLVSYWIKKSKIGYQLNAIANSQEAAESLGVNSRELKLKAAAISAFFCALGGTFYVQNVLVCTPGTMFGEALSDELVIVSMIGGKGTIIGPTLGALIVRTLSQATNAIVGSNIPGLHLAIYGVMLVLCIRFFPDGIWALIKKAYAKIKAKKETKAIPATEASKKGA